MKGGSCHQKQKHQLGGVILPLDFPYLGLQLQLTEVPEEAGVGIPPCPSSGGTAGGAGTWW
jgi:hypothetical protein